MNRHPETTSVVVGQRLFSIQVAPTDPPRSMRVTIVVDGRSAWTFDQPGWRPVALGVGARGAFLWSARQVIALPAEPAEAPAVAITVDEDLEAVFRDPDGWTLVCETSVRRLVDGQETDRIDLDDVIATFRWKSHDALFVRTGRGSEQSVVVRGARLLQARTGTSAAFRDAGPSVVLPRLTLIGYWDGELATGWPDPADFIDAAWDRYDRDAVADYLGRGFVVRAYMGYSPCRLCGQNNGCLELSDGTYVWPEGLAHYVTDHDVRPPERFVAHALATMEAYEKSDRDESWWRGEAG